MVAANSHIPMALTMGDPAGIGPEIILKAFATSPQTMQGCCVFGNAQVMSQALAFLPKAMASQITLVPVADVPSAMALPMGHLPVCSVTADAPIASGVPSANGGRMAADAVVAAAQAALRSQVAAVVTAPLHKKALAMAGVNHPGHTELLQSLAADHLGCQVAELPVRMMLSRPGLRVVLVSIHVPLRVAIDQVTHDQVLQTLVVTDRAWVQMHGHRPKVWVAGLNPHAGEDGLFGQEETQAIAPAVASACAMGMTVKGPFPPDTVFMQALQSQTPDKPDVVVAMYHDQGLIPVKLQGLADGVNQTLGLPFVRTSPDHGTAFDIAGQGLADPASLLCAVAEARRCANLIA